MRHHNLGKRLLEIGCQPIDSLTDTGMLYLAYQNHAFKSQIEYVFQAILNVYGVAGVTICFDDLAGIEFQPSNIVISYGKEKPRGLFTNHIHIYESALFGENYLTARSMPRLPLGRYGGIPVIYEGDGDVQNHMAASQMKSRYRSIETNVDIIASSFFMLSRYEEIVSTERDQYGRFPARESIAYKEGFVDRPVVNEYLELLWNWIDSFGLGIMRKPLWPQGKDFAVCLTHDVDHVRKWESDRHSARLLLGDKPFEATRLWSGSIVSMLKRENPYWNFEEIVAREKQYGFNSSFYFLAGRHHPFDGSYKINSNEVRALIKWLENEGAEVGLHGSFESYNNEAMLSNELATLTSIAKNVCGVRQHRLRLDPQLTFSAQEKAGLGYDTTLGFAEHEGYRSGIAFPYHPYDLRRNRPFALLEIPLTIMDGTLSQAQYRNLTPDKGWEATRKILETTKRFKSCVTLLWHNSCFAQQCSPGFGDIYWKALEWIHDNNGWGASGREVCKWWIRR